MLNKMVADAESGKIPYGRLKEEKTLIGDSIKGVQNDYSKSTSQGRLKEIYGALAQDQLLNVEKLASTEVRQQLRSANLLTAKEKALGQRIVNSFGQDLEGSLGSKLRNAIMSGSRGDSADFNRLLKVVPDEYKKETVATALAAATRSSKGAEQGGFGFSEFANVYPKLRANPPVYKTIVDTLGTESAGVLRDLFEVSKRVTEARALVLTTGKANQALLQGMQAESLIGKIMESTIAKGLLVAGGTAIGGPVAGPLAAGGTSMALTALTQGNKEGVKAAGKLFADENFQSLLVESATRGTPSKATINKAANSQSFKRFADAVKLPKSVDQRIQYLESALQSGRNIEENQ
jgi:formiminotetrahydrofolate cyclodeaminase